jgi:hypothetical protein
MPELDSFAAPLSERLSRELRSALIDAPMPPLDEGQTQPALARLLDGGVGDHLIGVSAAQQMACLSGLWLVAGDIHRSHEISQDLPSAEGSFWHGIMHRREGDYGNAKYWFRRVGQHPVFEQIAGHSDGHYADPFDFVDACRDALQSGSVQEVERCEESQWTEWQALMLHVTGG